MLFPLKKIYSLFSILCQYLQILCPIPVVLQRNSSLYKVSYSWNQSPGWYPNGACVAYWVIALGTFEGFLGVFFVSTSVVYGPFRPNGKASFWPLWSTCHNLCDTALEDKISKNERIGTRTQVWHSWQVRKDKRWHSFFSTKFLTSFLKCHNRKRCQICETSYLPWHEIIQNMTTKFLNPLAVWISSWGIVLQI